MSSVQDLSQRVVRNLQKKSLNNVLVCRIFQLSRWGSTIYNSASWCSEVPTELTQRNLPAFPIQSDNWVYVCNQTHRILENLQHGWLFHIDLFPHICCIPFREYLVQKMKYHEKKSFCPEEHCSPLVTESCLMKTKMICPRFMILCFRCCCL